MALNAETNQITFEIEDQAGNTKLSFILDRKTGIVIRTSGCTVADIDGDYIFDTDNDLIRIQSNMILEEKEPDYSETKL